MKLCAVHRVDRTIGQVPVAKPVWSVHPARGRRHFELRHFRIGLQRAINRLANLPSLCETKTDTNRLTIVADVVEHNARPVIGIVGHQFSETERVRDSLLQSWRPVTSQIFTALINVGTAARALERCFCVIEVQQAVEATRSTCVEPIDDHRNGVEGRIQSHHFSFQRYPSAALNT